MPFALSPQQQEVTRRKERTFSLTLLSSPYTFSVLFTAPIIPLSLVSPGTSKQSKTAASLSFLRSNYAKMLKPGFNIVVISYWTGAVESVGQFNTKSASSPDVKKMENFLNTLPVDRVVLGIVKGEAYNGVKNNAKLKKAMASINFLPGGVMFALLIIYFLEYCPL